MEWFAIIVFCSFLLILVGGFIGHTLAERALDSRSRRQAAVQRQLNEDARRLRVAVSVQEQDID